MDDDPAVGAGFQRALRKYGQVIAVTTVAQARDQVQRERSWHAFLVDLQLPDGSGLDLIAELRRGWPLTPALLLTGHVDGGVANAAYDLGADVLGKPVDMGRIGRFIEKALSFDYAKHARPVEAAPVAEQIARLRSLLARRPVDVRTRCEIGAVVAELKSRPERYGVNAVATVASAVGEDVPSLYRHARVVERWGARELEVLIARRSTAGRALSWSHLVALSAVERPDRRAAWTERALREDLTLRQFEAALERDGAGG